jgi:hypothetical protein
VSARNLGRKRTETRSAPEVSAIPRQLDLRVHDRVALDEIELYAEVLSAVAAADRPLTAAELDEALGIRGSLTRRFSAAAAGTSRPSWSG